MRQILASIRLISILLVLVIGTPLVLLFGLMPLRTKSGARFATLPAGWMASAFLWIFNIRLFCSEPEKLRRHVGMVVCNHLSYADVVVLLKVTPVRFLAAAGVSRIPLIGWLASALETVFVNRGNQDSRDQARDQVSQKLHEQPFPPIAIFPEGKISDGTGLLPFRHGAFEIAMESGVSVLPCAITYTPLAPIHYYSDDDSLFMAVWKLASAPGGIHATLTAAPPVDANVYEEATRIADDSHRAIEHLTHKAFLGSA